MIENSVYDIPDTTGQDQNVTIENQGNQFIPFKDDIGSECHQKDQGKMRQ